jgi:hypothetical protein
LSVFALRHRRTVLVGTAVIGASVATVLASTVPSAAPLPTMGNAAREFARSIQGIDEAGGAGAETDEVRSILGQFSDARNAPGLAQEGGYSAALKHVEDMGPAVGGTWHEMTGKGYNADDKRYFDYYANTSGGAGYVTGRVQAMASSAHYVFAGGAAGGVYRKAITTDGSGTWQLVSGAVDTLTVGALAYKGGKLWLATGDGSSGGTTYSGDGVWVGTGVNDAIGGISWEHVNKGDATSVNGTVVNTGKAIFDGAVINQLRFSRNGWVYAATDYGVWRHSTSDLDSNWHKVFVPKPASLPSADTNPAGSALDNYTSDIAIDPNNPNHVVVAYGWVVGGASNGWYEGRFSDGSWSFKKSSVTGAINPKNIGRTTFAWADDENARGRLYALVHNPDHAATGVSYSELGGVFMSTKGISGPWSKIADSQKLSQSGSALDPTITGAGSINGGYQPGVQAWYNQFLLVDPLHPKHVFMGLEEVYETRNAGSSWNTVGPYWNFYFGCWGSQPDITQNEQLGCKITPHSDQHAITISNDRVYVGNDGGVYSRPANGGDYYGGGHGADWISETKSDSPDFLQYYSVGVGKVDSDKVADTSAAGQAGFGEIISGGLQDNGGSILFASGNSTEGHMGSNFGGDGGDVLVDPNDGCRIVQEYVELSMRVTNTCAATSKLESFLDLSQATTRSIRPPESLARFIAPFAADHTDINKWIAGGNHVWYNDRGFNIASGADWKMQFALGTNPSETALRESTAVAANDGQAIVGFCGSCATGSFESGIAFGPLGGASDDWTVVNVGETSLTNGTGTLPTRWIQGADVYKVGGTTHYMLGFNGFGRRWVEGPGAGVGHVFDSTDGTHWTRLDGTGDNALPDVPVSSVKHLSDGRVVVGTDLGAFIKDAGANTWHPLGSGMPTTIVSELEPGAQDGVLYAATYGRGIWRLELSGVQAYEGGTACQDAYNNGDDPAEIVCGSYDATQAEEGTAGDTSSTKGGGRR